MLAAVKTLAGDIKFEHSVFALPFAYLGMILAARGLPSFAQILWITVAMISARTLAMTANRLIDREIDLRNPRTRSRAMPSGRLSPRTALAACVLSMLLLVFAAWQLNPVCLALSPVAAIVVVGYSYTKRFTRWCHLALGLGDAIAPVGGWLAVTGAFAVEPMVLALAVGSWIAGFDVIYACQDVEFDRANGLHSLPVAYGVATALRISIALHVVTALSLLALAPLAGLGPAYLVGWVVATGLLVYEHSLVSASDLSKLGVAFFNVNGYIAVVVCAAAFLGLVA